MLSRFTKLFLCVILILLLLASCTLLRQPLPTYLDLPSGTLFSHGGVEKEFYALPINTHERPSVIPHAKGGVIMSKLGNETAKAALGRATWKLLHTMTLRYPEHPTDDEREAIRSYFYLTSRLYPCGECAAEFQQLLELYPPQTSSRLSASSWLCFIHNKVNERLEKPTFDCAHLDAEYDCGCGDESDKSTISPSTTKDILTGADLVAGG
ncbi:ERV/ALR sulfhydryl oxidase domain-containing protein [Russula earlei]|uniref:ERV/ALR sulfhydryl oxidase domain-containing protein n=1 Tax=Russula earlei TaxID=71964 RepID=A0ACC0UK79_9AGAM|nr:ERV/ALR sulfhydryl oxidase domain-containing protein [Russula earlei]